MVPFGEVRYGMKRFFLGLLKYSMWKLFNIENFSVKQSIKLLGYHGGCHNGANNLGVCMGANGGVRSILSSENM